MTKEEIIRLAREAGAEFAELPMTDAIVFSVEDRAWNSAALHRFAALVAAHEREACAKVCDEQFGVERIAQECAAAIRSRT